MTIDGHTLSKRETCNYTKRKATFNEIASSTEQFLFSNFRGAVSIFTNELHHAYTLIAPEGFALLFKLLLAKIYGGSVLRIEFGSEKGEMHVYCEWDNVELDEEFITRLCSIGRESGFAVTYAKIDGKYKITISIKEDKRVLVSLYAVGTREILTAFNLVFYT